MKRLPQVEQRISESDYPLAPLSPAPGEIASIEDMAARIAHDVNNPLTIVLANVDFLLEMMPRVSRESSAYVETSAGTEWLRAHLTEAEICLADLRDAAERIRVAVDNLAQQRTPPAGQVAPAEEETPPSTDVRVHTSGPAPRKTRILVVDDERDVAKALARMLDGYDVVSLGAEQARDSILDGETFDAILCDVMMPDLPGHVLHAEITRVAPEQAARMIFITGGALTPDAVTFLAKVNQPVLRKPCTASELRAVVQKLLG